LADHILDNFTLQGETKPKPPSATTFREPDDKPAPVPPKPVQAIADPSADLSFLGSDEEIIRRKLMTEPMEFLLAICNRYNYSPGNKPKKKLAAVLARSIASANSWKIVVGKPKGD